MPVNDNSASLSVLATTSDKLKNIVIKNGQMIFVQDKHRIAFDFNNKRVFYNQIIELETDLNRINMSSPSDGYYFVIDTAVLWSYQNGWLQITEQPEEIVFIGTELPELGQAKSKTLYVDKFKKEISVYDDVSNEYIIVANKSDGDSINVVTNTDIDSLFLTT